MIMQHIYLYNSYCSPFLGYQETKLFLTLIKIIIWKAHGVPKLVIVIYPEHQEEEETLSNRKHMIGSLYPIET